MKTEWMRIVGMATKPTTVRTKKKNFVAGMIMLMGKGDVTMINSLPMF